MEHTSLPRRWVLILCLSLLLLLVLFLAGESACYHLPGLSGTDSYQESGWQFGPAGEDPIPVSLSAQLTLEPGTTYVLSTALTYDGAGDPAPAAFITACNYELRVLLEDQELFRYTREEMGLPRVQSLGTAAFTVPLGAECRGKTLSLELRSPFRQPALRRLPDIVLGDSTAILMKLFLDNLPRAILTGAILFASLFLLILGAETRGGQLAHLYFALFALLVVIYRIPQDLFLQYLWGNPLMSFLLELFSVILFPIPILLGSRRELSPLLGRTFLGVVFGLGALFLGEVILHFTGRLDIVQLMPLTHGAILFSTGVLLFGLGEARSHHISLTPFRKLIPILLGTLLDLVSYFWHIRSEGSGSFFPQGDFIGLGLLISLFLLFWEARQDRAVARREAERNRLLEEMAYRDSLTGLSNRAAFTREIASIQAGKHRDQTIVVAAFDLNGLKKVNDSHGHAEGDLLIQRAAGLMERSFRNYGQVFRTGGDEFFALFYGLNENLWHHLEQRYLRELQAENRDAAIPLSIAMGYAVTRDCNLDYCIQMADRRMYQDKNLSPEHRDPQLSPKEAAPDLTP